MPKKGIDSAYADFGLITTAYNFVKKWSSCKIIKGFYPTFEINCRWLGFRTKK